MVSVFSTMSVAYFETLCTIDVKVLFRTIQTLGNNACWNLHRALAFSIGLNFTQSAENVVI